jgi:uncharacterized protein (TIGR00730 family)
MNVCVFCGSSFGESPLFSVLAKEIGQQIGSGGHTLVYGGGKVGLMGIVADATLASNGKAIGIIPDFLHKREVAHKGLTQLHIVSSMHERKFKMADLSDAFVVLPGGLGTLDEVVEILTWKQLGLINKPVAIINFNNYFNPFFALMETMVSNGFLSQNTIDRLIISENPKNLIASFSI